MDVCLEVDHAPALPNTDALRASFSDAEDRRWYALFTIPQNEKAVDRHLGYLRIESFLPTYCLPRIWKNRQRTTAVLPLFPNYVFVRIRLRDRFRLLQIPGVVQIVGKMSHPIPLPDAEIEFLRSDFWRRRIEPFPELVIGRKVRIRRGIMRGVEGILIRKNNRLHFVLSLALINQQAAVEVSAEDLELAN